MPFNAFDFQIVALLLAVVIFGAAERLWPAHRVDHGKDFAVDLLSFVFALGANRAANRLIRPPLEDLPPEFLQQVLGWLQSLSSPARVVLALVLSDFVIYWIHRAQHSFPILWRTHAWHHSVEQMYWFAGFRTSFFHSLFNNIPQAFFGVVVFRFGPAEIAAGYCLGIAVQFIDHTNWKLSLGPLNRLLVTPDYHRIHHAASLHRGKNLAGVFRIWDILFGTYVDPETAERGFALGLDEQVERKRIPRLLAGL